MVEVILILLIILTFISVLVINYFRTKYKRNQAKNQNLDSIYDTDWSHFCSKSILNFEWSVNGWFCYRFRKHKYFNTDKPNANLAIQLSSKPIDGKIQMFATIYRDYKFGKGITLIMPKGIKHISDVQFSRSYFENTLLNSENLSFESVEKAISYVEFFLQNQSQNSFGFNSWSFWQHEGNRPWSDYCTKIDENHFWSDDSNNWFFLRFRSTSNGLQPVIQLNGAHELITSNRGTHTYIPIYAAIFGDSHGKFVTLILPNEIKYLFRAISNNHLEDLKPATFIEFKTLEEAVLHANKEYSNKCKFLAEAFIDYREAGYHAGAVGTGSDCS